MRILPIALALLLPLAAGCDRLDATRSALATGNPWRSFEARCDALPPSRVEVTSEPTVVNERRDVPYATLSARQHDPSGARRTVGLTEAELRHTSTIEFAGVVDGRGRACMRPSVEVRLSATPITVYVASEYRGDPCRERSILEHEYLHVDAYRSYVREAAPALASALRARIGAAPHYGPQAEATREALDRTIRQELAQFMAQSERELALRNTEIDSPQAYEGISLGCGGPSPRPAVPHAPNG